MVRPPVYLEDPAGYLRHHLPADYVPPYGTQLTPDNFDRCTDTRNRTRTIHIANPTGSEDTYRLHLTSADSLTGRQLALCEGPDGMMIEHLHAHTKKASQQAPIEQWYDFLAVTDAQARQQAAGNRPWDGHGVQQQLYRFEHNLVTSGKVSANTANFQNNREFAEWMNSAVRASPVYFNVLALSDMMRFQDHADGSLMHLLHESQGARLGGGRLPESLNLTGQVPKSLHDLGDNVPCTISFELRVNGAETEHFHGEYMAFLNRVDTNFQDRHDTPGWYGIIPMTVNAVMPVPSRGAIVTVHHDNDGASVRVEVSCEAHATRQNILEEQFARRWGRWLDPDVTLSQAELDNGVQTIEATVQQRRECETPEGETHGRAH